MTQLSSRALSLAASKRARSTFAINSILRTSLRTLLVSWISMILPAAAAMGQALTTTTLAITNPVDPTVLSPTDPTHVPYKTPITLTATVTYIPTPTPPATVGSPAAVTTGLVLFCDASAAVNGTLAVCENNSALGLVQVTKPTLANPNSTATLKLGSGPLGNHSYMAVYLANNLFASSSSNFVSYIVTGTYASLTTIGATGGVGSYTLTGTVSGVGAVISPGPSGDINFLDTSAGNNPLGPSRSLGHVTLSTTFASAPGSPFAIATPSTSRRSVAIASAYLDGDNNLDVVSGDYAQTITVLLGNGDGTFKSNLTYTGCDAGVAMKILLADFNRDGITDVALGCSTGSTGSLTILLGKGDGTFGAAQSFAAGDVAGIATGDFNGDGIIDFAVSNHLQRNIMIFTGKGNGTFNLPVTVLSPPSELHDVVVADFNGDGHDDLLYAINTAASNPKPNLSDLYLATGKGDGTFNTPVLIASQVGEFLATGDTNGDGYPDVISTTITGTPPNVGPSLFVIIGNGIAGKANGTFQPPVVYQSDIPSDPHLTDVNGDGKPDIIAGGSYGALVYLGNGDGTFKAYTEPTIGNFALTYAVNAGDFNNDGNADLIGTDADNPNAAVSLSQVVLSADAAALGNVAVFPLGSGTHNVDASYLGDHVYIPSVSITTPLLAAPTTTTVALAVSPSSGTLSGQPLTLTATLYPYQIGTPPPNPTNQYYTTTDTDTVNFYNGPPYNSTTLLGSGTLHNGVATFTTSVLPTGSDPISAVYVGDPNYLTSTSSTINVTVSNIVISSTLNPSLFSQSVTFTATVAAGTGSVTFYDGSTALATVNLTGHTATYSSSTLTVGLHSITAQYSGDTTHSAATSPFLTQEVDKVNTALAVSPSGPSTFGASVTITATVTAAIAGAPVPSGSVNFTSGGVTLGSGTLSPTGIASISTTTLPVGGDSITASYVGDTTSNPSTGTGTQTVGKATPTLPAPVASPGSPAAFAPVILTETVPAGVSGPVSFYNGTTLLGLPAPIVGGVATLSLTSLPTGSNSITATTPGDTNNNAATSPATAVTVTKINPTVGVTTSGPSTYNTPVTLTATVTGLTGAIAPGGNVIFTSGGLTLGTGTVNTTTGTATISTNLLPAGTDPITAAYSGDTNYNTASGATNQTVAVASPTVTVSTPGPTNYGSPVTITASVPPGTNGTITITSGGTPIGSGTVSPTGTVTVTTSTLPVGSDPITASYGGDSNSNPSTGSTTQTVNKATPSVTVTTPGPSNYAAPVIITATVPAIAAGTAVPTGNVTFTSGTLALGTGTLSSTGIATITTSILPLGSDPITATYVGDNNYLPNTGNTTQTVNRATPTVTVSTPGPSTFGGSVTITVTVPTGATGTVTVTSGGVTLGTGTVGSNGTVTVSTSSLPTGSDTITASYSGDNNYFPNTGTTTQTVNKITTTSTLTSSQNPSTIGASVTFTDTLSPTNVSGTVTFTSGGAPIGTGTVTNGVATVTTSILPGGSNSIVATYNGDTNDSTSTATLTQTVNRDDATVTVTTSGPSVFGNPVTVTATVPPGVTGTVTITSGGTTLGTGTVGPTNTVSVTTSSLPVGTDPIVATYSGDTNNNPATGTINQTVAKTLPTVTLTSSSNPSTTNQPVTFTATVPTGATGTVTFLDGTTIIGAGTINNGVATFTTSTLPIGNDPITASYPGDANNSASTSFPINQIVNKNSPVLPPPGTNPSSTDTLTSITITEQVPTGVTGPVTFSDGTTVLGTAPIINGVATLTVPPQPVGSDPITASTPADANNNAATSLPTIVTVVKATPVLPPPAVSSTNPVFGTPVIITETLPNGVTGPISFYDGGTLLGTATVTNGVATITVATLPLGANSITASSPANAIYNSATSPATTVNVAKAAGSISLTSSVNPASTGQSVTFTAVTKAGSSGSVTFLDGTTVIGVGAINASGIATFTTATLAIGSHPITASYAGDTNFTGETSAVLTEVVGKLPSATAVTQSSSVELLNSMVTFTAKVTTAAPTPTGTVVFYDGATAIGTAPLSTNGTAVVTLSNNGDASYSTTTLAAGSHTITAAYSGDASFMDSTSAPLTNIVADFTNKATGTTTQNLFPGDSTSYTFVLSPVGSSTFLSDTKLDIDGLPKGTTYTFSPAVIAAGSGPTTVTLKLTTSNALSAENHAPAAPGSFRPGLPIALSMLGLVGIGAIRRRRKQLPRLMMLALLAIASLLPIAAITGCAGGYFTLTPTHYSLDVTGTEGSIQHTASTTLIVQ